MSEPAPEYCFQRMVGHPGRMVGAMPNQQDSLVRTVEDYWGETIGHFLIIPGGGEEGHAWMAGDGTFSAFQYELMKFPGRQQMEGVHDSLPVSLTREGLQDIPER